MAEMKAISSPTDKLVCDVQESCISENKMWAVDKDNDFGGLNSFEPAPHDNEAPDLMSLNFGFLPDVAVREVLKNIPSNTKFDQEILLNSRLVCVQWNEIIKSTSQLMMKIAFPIRDVFKFLDLEIVKDGKVKSIIFKNVLPLKSEFLDSFIEAISNTVEKVQFTFQDDSERVEQIEFFQLILAKCTNIQELIVGENPEPFGVEESDSESNVEWFRDPNGLFRGFTAATQISARNKITKISVDINGAQCSEKEVTGLSNLLLQLPNLKEIEIFGVYDSWDEISVFSGLYEYLKKFGTTLKLKKLSLNQEIYMENADLSFYNNEELMQLLILCGKYQIQVDKLPKLYLDCLLELSELPEMNFTQQHGPLLPMKVDAQLGFDLDSPLTNLNRLYSLRMGKLELLFGRQIIPGEVNWIRHLQELECLTLTMTGRGYGEQKLDSDSMSEMEYSFSAGVPSLKVLSIDSIEIFELAHINRWSQYFPTINELHIKRCNFIPNDLIAQLTILESLSTLCLAKLPNLTNDAFTSGCFNIFGSNENPPPLVPAITCFKSLKLLYLQFLPLLTDTCIVNGIAKCQSLEKLVVEQCENLSKNGCKFVKCEVVFKDFWERFKGDNVLHLYWRFIQDCTILKV